MNVTIVDYNSGNISSVINSFTEVAKGTVNLEVTSDLKKIKEEIGWKPNYSIEDGIRDYFFKKFFIL